MQGYVTQHNDNEATFLQKLFLLIMLPVNGYTISEANEWHLIVYCFIYQVRFALHYICSPKGPSNSFDAVLN